MIGGKDLFHKRAIAAEEPPRDRPRA